MFTQLHYRAYDAQLQERERRSSPHRVVGNTWLRYDTPLAEVMLRDLNSVEAIKAWLQRNVNVDAFAWRVLEDTGAIVWQTAVPPPAVRYV